MRSGIFVLTLFSLFLYSLQSSAQAVFQSPEAKVWADSILLDMTMDEKIGQLFMVAAYSNLGEDHQKKMLKLIREDHIGGMIFFQGGPVRQANLTNLYQDETKIPLMIGYGCRVGPGHAPRQHLQVSLVHDRRGRPGFSAHLQYGKEDG